jgi:hypothetical protein
MVHMQNRSEPKSWASLKYGFVAIGLFLLSASPGNAQREGPFAALPGSWSGSGTITMSNGSRERIRCDGRYQLASQTNVQIQLNCASDSYRFQLRGDAVANDRTLAGTWSEASRGVAGKIFGRINGNRLEMRADGQTFSALLNMTTRGSRQTISIRSPGSEMSEVSISLSRRSR